MPMNEMIARASAAQAKASDPAASVFVSANAGTGKTKLLTDRVLRLLLSWCASRWYFMRNLYARRGG
jgi:ATP-dependent helicase/nuclease subunit A